MKFRCAAAMGAVLLLCVSGALSGRDGIRRVDFAAAGGIRINGAGPLLVRADPLRRRVVVVHNLTASVSLIQAPGNQVTGIPLASRVPHYLKSSALAIRPRTGQVYVVGDRCLHRVDPQQGVALCLETPEQAEMVAVNDRTGTAYLVGRESPNLMVVDFHARRVRGYPWLKHVDAMVNRNATPPPPLRKVVWDDGLNRVFALDADTRCLAEFSPAGRLLRRRPLAVAEGERWHLAGFNAPAHAVYVVIETAERRVVQAARIHLDSGRVETVALPGLTEAVGVSLDPTRRRVFIPYDNHPTVHCVDFSSDPAAVTEIAVPAFGNDASVVAGDRLWVASWAHSEVLDVDLRHPLRLRRHRRVEVLPHMFQMAYLPDPDRLYVPSGATAVNGAFGATLSCLDPESGTVTRVATGWSPVGVALRRDAPGVLVFNSEDRMALVNPDGTWEERTLPVRYMQHLVQGRDGRVYVAFGAHQSFWPVFYIGGAWNGVLDVDPLTLAARWRRLPRLAQAMVLDGGNRLFALQNNWGGEEQFLAVLPDPVREFDTGKRWKTGDKVVRETTQRLLAWDAATNRLFLVRAGEAPGDPGILHILNAADGTVERRLEVGRTPVALEVAGEWARICAFDDRSVVEVHTLDGVVRRRSVGSHPIGLKHLGGRTVVLCQGDRTLWLLDDSPGPGRPISLPSRGTPTGIFSVEGSLWLILHAPDTLRVLRWHPGTEVFDTLLEEPYPYGRVSADSNNAAFFMRGQYGDCRYDLNHLCRDKDGRVYLSDFLSGRLWILDPSALR